MTLQANRNCVLDIGDIYDSYTHDRLHNEFEEMEKYQFCFRIIKTTYVYLPGESV